MRNATLEVTVEELDDETDLRVDGEIDASTGATLDAALVAAVEACAESHGLVVVDCSAVAFIDAHGVDILLAALARAEALEVALVLQSPSRPVLRLLEVRDVRDRFTVED